MENLFDIGYSMYTADKTDLFDIGYSALQIRQIPDVTSLHEVSSTPNLLLFFPYKLSCIGV